MDIESTAPRIGERDRGLFRTEVGDGDLEGVRDEIEALSRLDVRLKILKPDIDFGGSGRPSNSAKSSWVIEPL